MFRQIGLLRDKQPRLRFQTGMTKEVGEGWHVFVEMGERGTGKSLYASADARNLPHALSRLMVNMQTKGMVA